MAALVDVALSADDAQAGEATLQKWLKTAGQTVTAHEPIAELETDKVVVELAAPADGTLVELLKTEGERFEPGEVLARIDTSGAAAVEAGGDPELASASPDVATPARAAPDDDTGAARRLSPAVRRLLERHGLSPAAIDGTGEHGRITADDVERVVAARTGSSPATQVAGESRIVPHDSMRRNIARHMAQSLATAPHVTSVFEADLSAVLAHRQRHRDAFAANGVRLTVTAYVVAACVDALTAVPEVNGRFHDDHLEIFSDLNIGVGTALGDKGLIVPVIHRAQVLDLAGIAGQLTTLTEKARDGRLEPHEVRGGTFTISNHGVGGSLVAAPIVINQPQVAILGVGRVEKRVCVIDRDGRDSLEVRPRCYVSLTIDHRALDAYQTNRFLARFVEALDAFTG